MSECVIGIGDVLWVQVYEITWGDSICVPVRYSEPACEAITKGHLRLITLGDAGQLNQGFIDRNRTQGASQFLNEALQKAWDAIKSSREGGK